MVAGAAYRLTEAAVARWPNWGTAGALFDAVTSFGSVSQPRENLKPAMLFNRAAMKMGAGTLTWGMNWSVAIVARLPVFGPDSDFVCFFSSAGDAGMSGAEFAITIGRGISESSNLDVVVVYSGRAHHLLTLRDMWDGSTWRRINVVASTSSSGIQTVQVFTGGITSAAASSSLNLESVGLLASTTFETSYNWLGYNGAMGTTMAIQQLSVWPRYALSTQNRSTTDSITATRWGVCPEGQYQYSGRCYDCPLHSIRTYSDMYGGIDDFTQCNCTNERTWVPPTPTSAARCGERRPATQLPWHCMALRKCSSLLLAKSMLIASARTPPCIFSPNSP